MKQLWHLPLSHLPIQWTIAEEPGAIEKQKKEGYVSEWYGRKEVSEMVIFATKDDHIFTEIEIKG